MKAFLILEDGTVFQGTSIGSTREVISEIVFNTSMTGYLEVLTDPSYAGQAVTMTYPLIGNYGICHEDMESSKVMDRLICGDVGYGKTEVAIRAVFKACMDQKQVAVLVPTTILAQQHYNTFKQRFANYPIRVEVLSRFKTAKQQREIINDARKGLVDILIGTHRIISKDINMPNLGLVVLYMSHLFLTIYMKN